MWAVARLSLIFKHSVVPWRISTPRPHPPHAHMLSPSLNLEGAAAEVHSTDAVNLDCRVELDVQHTSQAASSAAI